MEKASKHTATKTGSPERGSDGASDRSHITPGHVRASHAITSQLYDNVTLWSCRINGDPGVAIVIVNHVGEGKVAVMPLFVAITAAMDIQFDDEQGSSSGSTGGPSRYDTLRAYDAPEPGGAA